MSQSKNLFTLSRSNACGNLDEVDQDCVEDFSDPENPYPHIKCPPGGWGELVDMFDDDEEYNPAIDNIHDYHGFEVYVEEELDKVNRMIRTHATRLNELDMKNLNHWNNLTADNDKMMKSLSEKWKQEMVNMVGERFEELVDEHRRKKCATTMSQIDK